MTCEATRRLVSAGPGVITMLPVRVMAAALFITAGLAVSASAAPVTYSGEDLMATTSSPDPNAAAAAASFDAEVTSLGGGSLINFESAPLGSFSNLAVAPGVTINGTDSNSANQSIRDTSNTPGFPTLDGYNTTSGGSHFVEMMGGNLVFSFATPIQSFGAYLSGIQTSFFADTVTFSDGTSQTLTVPGAGTSSSVGALAFVGFTDPGASITSVTINAGVVGNAGAGFDDIGVDDVRFQDTAAAVPEPGSVGLLMMGCLFSVAFGYRYRGRARGLDV
jgi:PEP-CTERM motif